MSEQTPPRLASTVLLLRDNADTHQLEVFVQQRVGTMKFAAGMTVFPGGRVDPRDRPSSGTSVPWCGADAHTWATMLNVDADTAAALVIAAVRETFEETGTLVATTADGEVVTTTEHLRQSRYALEDRTLAMSQFLRDNDLSIGADLLRPWGNWVTPPWLPTRFDTFFFLAAQPPHQRADGDTGESERSRWAAPQALLDEWEDGQIGLMPPTWYQLNRLREATTAAQAMEMAREPMYRTTSDFLGEKVMDPFFAVADHLGGLRDAARAHRDHTRPAQ
ncbi:NUDIX domain-containing protein [Corynebacterium sp. TAE3-ERU12]|uniref:NUDIX hydrolase n=1 Tax=Corynebacterium sp. TAE3-ERU12 TaxID=2849491 RepID=UPI001C452AA0|nr:NUDIX domain-containing protein [Corynebacterium sp. TAE3-ERU12]MBV7295124.1 NUDIX domain-containing protein [Corynebacterium sp. TAE3-ERU12]